jgi:hypothetical protein
MKEGAMPEHKLEFKDRKQLEEWILDHSTREEIDVFVQKLQARRDDIERKAQEAAKPPRLSESIRDQKEMLLKLSAAVVKLTENQGTMEKVLEELQKKNR